MSTENRQYEISAESISVTNQSVKIDQLSEQETMKKKQGEKSEVSL